MISHADFRNTKRGNAKGRDYFFKATMKESFFLSNGTVIQVRAKFNEGADIRKFIYTNFPDDGHGNGETINYSYTASYDAIVTISQP